ncbi:hypothetical protein BN59_00903 [Legionella massiliensis]|uniref:Uncharacterized protein n=1 Tax=Legionella massiliensis TaxID=1034943 RepID=A0A078KXZ6_9GAMM|nr:hypothetical protein [Legionella massiliensis]CDZ76629.1 hypothetical protein BN59_00903 [Legionella massiliensis]CEE12367.1 hypothetical protein BN1094_00903 [Legionella massiliensis]
MHYSDTYNFIKQIKDKELAAQLKQELKKLEASANDPSFIHYLREKQDGQEKDIFALRKEYDLMQLNKVVIGIEAIDTKISEGKEKAYAEDVSALNAIQRILADIKRTAKKQVQTLNYRYRDNYQHFHELAQEFATHYLPFNQSNDPFKGSDFSGYCWGHTHQYGKLISQGLLDHLSTASNKDLYKTFRQNWTFADILFRRVGWYFKVNLEAQMRAAIWNALKDMDDQTTFNFNFLIKNHGFHSTSLRMVGEGMEYYENNYGVVRFNTREEAVNFLVRHLLHEASNVFGGEVSFITVYKLPYSNDPTQDLFVDLPLAKVKKESKSEDQVEHPQELKTAIHALQTYINCLQTEGATKGKIKANELRYLVDELNSLPVDEVKSRVDDILANKEHSLMLNRGTGLYFFMSGFKSHSTTESLLQDISNVVGVSDPLNIMI